MARRGTGRPPALDERTVCSGCGHEVGLDSIFCDACGGALSRSCPQCSASLRASARFCDSCGQPLTTLVPPAQVAPARRLPAALGGGRYEVRRFLGEGGKKRVYLARDTRLDRDVAVAVIKTEGLDAAGLARVRREARAMGRLSDHPNVVTVYDVGEDGCQPYIVSQHIAGGSLEDLLRRAEKQRPPIEHVLRLAIDICRALEHAHTHNVIHRDLKPSNVWLSDDGTAKLGDFGLALALDRSRLTVEGMMLGTVAYMAPEQALGRPPDRRSDLYALGAVLYEMLTGRPPFLGDDAVAVISQHINTPPVAPSWHNAEVPRALEALVLQLLAKAPEDRPPTAAAVLEALGAIGSAAALAERVSQAEANPLDRLASGVFVGREAEMDALRAALEGALSGRGSVVLLTGEPGIGKTRTAEELVTYARLRKMQALWGRCHEGEGAPAYWPWIQAIRTYIHERDPKHLLTEMGSGAANIAQVVSELRDCLPGLATAGTLEPEQARFRLFDSITTFLRNAAANQPLVLVLDDLHWADKPSLLLLQFLARELRRTRVLVIGTYRDVGVGRRHPLSDTLGEFAREQLAERVILRGLTERDVARFIEITAGLKPPSKLIEAVYRETEGNPFFVNEVVRLLVADGRLQHPERVTSWSVGIPQGVREVVGRRLERLSAECNRVLTIASVIGREFNLDVLERVTDLATDRLLETLDEAIAARVITEMPKAIGRYSFSHALIRETLYEELPATRRARLHRQIGETLESLHAMHPEPHLASLAHHFFEAAQVGDVERAISYAVRAGDRAAAFMAHEEAVRLYEIALQALDLQEDRDAARCPLLLKLGEVLWRAGEYERARATALEAASAARETGAAEDLARATLGYGGRLIAFAALSPDSTLVALLEEALQALGRQDCPLRALMLARLAEEVTFSESFERREALCREAVTIARRLDDRGVLATVLRSVVWALMVPETLDDRIALAQEIVQLAEGAGERAVVLEGHMFRLWGLLEYGDVPGAKEELAPIARLATELRQPYYLWYVATSRVFLAFVEGRLGEVEGLAEEAFQIGQQTQNKNAELVFSLETMMLLREQGRGADVGPFLEAAKSMYPLIRENLRTAEALNYVDQGREAEARHEFEQLAANDFAGLARNAAWLFSIAWLAEVCAYLGDEARAEGLYQRLRPFGERQVTIGPILCFGAVARYLGLLATTLHRWDEARAHFECALELDGRTGMRQDTARTQLGYAEMLLARDLPEDRPRALALLNDALASATILGMRAVMERALALKLRVQGVDRGHITVSIDAVVSLVERERPDLRPHAAADGTVTILFTDIEESTAMFQRLGDDRALEVLRGHEAVVRREVTAHGGVIIKSQGDGFMVAFRSARRGLECAVTLQRALREYGAEHPDAEVHVRVGLHAGEALRHSDDLYGRTVIVAARIADKAAGGEILVSSLVRELTESSGAFSFGDLQRVELKGLTGGYEVCAVGWE